MEYQNLGRTGLKVSRVIVGGGEIGGVIGPDETKELVHHAWDGGVSTFYTGDDYQVGNTERVLGEVLKPRRDDVVLMVKCGYRVGAHTVLSPQGSPVDGGEGYVAQALGTVDHHKLWQHGVAPTSRGLGRKHLYDALHASLRRLQTDYIDIYVPHFWDAQVPIEETIDTLNDFVRQGKVRYLGASQHTAWQITRALWASDSLGAARYESSQLHASLVERTRLETDAPALAELGVSMVASAFDSGGLLRDSTRELGGGYRIEGGVERLEHQIVRDAVDHIRAVAHDNGRSTDELAAAWLLAQRSVLALMVVSMKPQDMDSAVRATDAPLTASEAAALKEITDSLPLSINAAIARS